MKRKYGNITGNANSSFPKIQTKVERLYVK